MMCCYIRTTAYVPVLVGVLVLSSATADVPNVTIVLDGRAVLPIVGGSVCEPAEELHRYLRQISGAGLERVGNTSSLRPGGAVYVGLVRHFHG